MSAVEQITPLNIYQRISKVMAAVDYIQKQKAAEGLPYTFVKHDAVTKALHPLFVEHGIVMQPTILGWKNDGNRTEVDVLVRFVNIDNPEDSIEMQMLGFGVDKQDKGPGKAISYACKYAMLKLAMLETGDDIESSNEDHITSRAETLINSAMTAMLSGDWVALHKMDRANDQDWMAAWGQLKSSDRTEIKRLKGLLKEYRDSLNLLAEAGDEHGFEEVDSELTADQARFLHNHLGEKAKAMQKSRRKEK